MPAQNPRRARRAGPLTPASLIRITPAAFLLGSALLAACAPAPRPLLVEVRDAHTKRPAAGVSVVAQTPSRDHPFSIASLLGQTGPHDARAQTDARGVARLEFMPGRPVRLGVLAPGWDAGFVLFDPDAPGFDASAWHAPGTPPIPGRAGPEFRARAAEPGGR
jgi:hypothetical protein